MGMQSVKDLEGGEINSISLSSNPCNPVVVEALNRPHEGSVG
jgi:hypothetical protein